VQPAAAIELEGVSKRYGIDTQAVAALTNVGLTVPAGQFVSIMGASGSGKSTLLNLVAGLDSPSEGRVVVNGANLAQLSDDERSDLRLQQIGFVFQSFNLFPSFSVEENVSWPLKFLRVGWRTAQQRAAAALQQVGIEVAARGRRPAELSGGEQQRIAIARALVTEPRLLLADEPTGNLDSRTGQAVLDLLLRLNADGGLTVMMVTHNAFAASCGHRTVELRDGCIVRDAQVPRGIVHHCKNPGSIEGNA
jgi:putative ABC transport system ATP-binding protein